MEDGGGGHVEGIAAPTTTRAYYYYKYWYEWYLSGEPEVIHSPLPWEIEETKPKTMRKPTMGWFSPRLLPETHTKKVQRLLCLGQGPARIWNSGPCRLLVVIVVVVAVNPGSVVISNREGEIRGLPLLVVVWQSLRPVNPNRYGSHRSTIDTGRCPLS